MKAIIALALAVTGAHATGKDRPWRGIDPFECVKPSNKLCPPGSKPDFDFNGALPGKGEAPEGFDYQGMNWKGFQFVKDEVKRDRLGRRTGGNHAVAKCGVDPKDPKKEDKRPSFGCSGDCGEDKGFDVDKIHVKPEFDCDLEFHYEMPKKPGQEKADICKTRQKCFKSGTTVENKQCAGAKRCQIVYPPKPEKPQCSVTISKIHFSCVTERPSTTPGKPTTPPAATTTTTNPAPTTTKGTTTPAVPTSSSSAPCATCKASSSTTSPSAAGTTSSPPAPPAGTTTPTTTPGAPPTSSLTTSAAGPSSFGNNTTPGVPPTTPGVPPTSSVTTPSKPQEVPTTTSGVATTTSGVPERPKDEIVCPDVLPKCLNTFLFSVEGTVCKDNTDHGCFCPSKIFVQNVYSCLYAHGGSDTVISQAVIYFQGLCAAYCDKNPEIAGPTITSFLPEATPAPLPGVSYTTVVVTKTEVVPCTDKDGNTITLSGGVISSTTTTLPPITATLPQVGLTAVPSQTEVALVPVASVTTAAPIGPSPTGGPAPSIPAKPAGSQGLPSQSPKPTGPVVAGSGRANASLGLAGFVAIVAAFML